ncbi:PAS domain S-box-containing protein/diguanylate cyclase (GGDEF) domain-containing protein [Marinospirillum celere]|uniref:PAS domain S-box-containing protein/diguanylate cyclase (GGDEF) domain-containing protein n=1 Tax=Marinospirillum celere TaxID=1122252 RepID=A0A1I1ID40_9GAMM|nr:GGDEF domain-containing phosphodiesterase [Marinospirillum celere]SFC31150.1 PAS domain S-box-containing protein/diguanylate cyclase (GGDEF) domain-containing protein [Marinospirillum celere]
MDLSFLLAISLATLMALLIGLMAGYAYRKHKEKNRKVIFRLLKQVFDHTHDAVTITDPAGSIIAVNRTFTQVTGYSEAEVLGENPRILSSGYHDSDFYEDYWQTLLKEGIWQGEIWNRRKDGEIYLEWLTATAVKDADGEITHFVAVFTDITEHRRQEARLEHATEHDRLTGLPTTANTLRELSHQLPNLQKRWCLALVDIDNFRLVNASYGFAVGDQLLTSLARRLKECSKGLVARHASDVFICALPLTSGDDEGDRLALINNIREGISKPFAIKGKLMEFSFSIGTSNWQDATKTVNELLQEAELALHAAKAKGAGQNRHFTQELREDKNPLIMLQGLRDALANNELSLNFQPLVNAATHQIHTLEVLLRWDHPTLGRIPPDKFIPMAERHGLMEALGQWILDQSLRHYAYWQHLEIAPSRLAVNVSPLEFQAENFVDNLLSLLNKYQLPPDILELELTEGVFVEQDEDTLKRLDALSSAGVHLAIDDFGTGYSSLAYLKHLPVNQLKLDRAFIRGLPANEADRAIVESTLALCRGLKMTVVAEGVEDENQADYLKRKGCDLLQGYYFGRPCDAEATQKLLVQQRVQSANFS